MKMKASAARALKGIRALLPKHPALKSYADMEACDVGWAASVVGQVASLLANEAAQGEPDDVAELGDILRALLTFMAGEIDELIAAAPQAASDNEGVSADMPAMMSGQRNPSGLSLNYIKALHLPIDEQKFRDELAVKFIGRDEVTGYIALWGSPDLTDVETDFFTKSTDFWDKVIGYPRPLTWDHAQDKQFKADPVIGQILEMGDDEVGRWYHAALDRKHKYFNAVAKLVGGRDLGTSSDSAPQYVERERTKSGAHWLKRWALFGGALTTTPAEPRMWDTTHWKSLGLDMARFVDSQAAHAAAQNLAERVAASQRSLELLKVR